MELCNNFLLESTVNNQIVNLESCQKVIFRRIMKCKRTWGWSRARHRGRTPSACRGTSCPWTSWKASQWTGSPTPPWSLSLRKKNWSKLNIKTNETINQGGSIIFLDQPIRKGFCKANMTPGLKLLLSHLVVVEHRSHVHQHSSQNRITFLCMTHILCSLIHICSGDFCFQSWTSLEKRDVTKMVAAKNW